MRKVSQKKQNLIYYFFLLKRICMRARRGESLNGNKMLHSNYRGTFTSVNITFKRTNIFLLDTSLGDDMERFIWN